MAQQQNIPNNSTPLVDPETGRATPAFYQFLIALFENTGGGTGGAVVQMGGDVDGPSDNAEVVSTHLASPLPITQGGTNASTAAGARSQLGLGTAATQNYSTGTWTPTIGGSTTLGAQTYVSQVGFWARIGDILTAWGRVEISAVDGAAAGNIIVGGLPVAAMASGAAGFAAAISDAGFFNLSAGYSQIVGDVGASGQTIRLREVGDNVTAQALAIAALGATARIMVSVSYRVA